MASQLTRPVTVIVLAAGEGRRYAERTGRFKLLEPLADGRAVIRAVCETALDVADDVVVVQHWHTARVADVLCNLPVRQVACRGAASGMGASLKCGVLATPLHHDVLIMLADMPFVRSGTIRDVRRAVLEGAAMARPFFGKRPGHPVGFSYRMRAPLLDLDDAQGAAPLLRSRQPEVVKVDSDDAGCVHDVDLPTDLPA